MKDTSVDVAERMLLNKNSRLKTCIKFERVFERKYGAVNIQNNKTPKTITKKMVDLYDKTFKNKKILVLYNYEFLEELISDRKVDPSNIWFGADCHEYMQAVAKEVYGVNAFYIGNDKEIEEVIPNMRYDICFTNPPYNKNMDLNIISNLYDVCDEIIVVHPGTWAFEKKGTFKKYIDFKNKLKDHIESIEVFNGNPIFGIAIWIPCVITKINSTKTFYRINVAWPEKQQYYTIEDAKDLSLFGENYFKYCKPFIKLVEDAYKKDNIDAHKICNMKMSEQKEDKFYYQIPAIRGHDFDSITLKNDDICFGLRADAMIVFEFDNENERMNFRNYIKTDFARFCLAQIKINQHLSSGELSGIPWMDFTQEWDDTKLYKHFKIPKEIQEFITDFLPDYYNLRK